jgi:hypothetical protein
MNVFGLECIAFMTSFKAMIWTIGRISLEIDRREVAADNGKLFLDPGPDPGQIYAWLKYVIAPQ